jgi:hypothetical protein
MNVERDRDRQLRAWVSEGVDRAPERFIWAALDEIERLPQRGPWRTGLEGLVSRLRPATAVLGVAATVVAAIIALQFTLPDRDHGGSTRAFAVADLQRIVVWDDTMPPTWTLDNLVSNPRDVFEVPIRTVTPSEAKLPDGYVGGRFTNFSGPAGAFMSWGTVFETAMDARAALPMVANELESPLGWGYGPGESVAIGDGGWWFVGETTSFTGPPGTNQPIPSEVYLWRNGNALLAVGGWFEFDPDEIRAVAEGMDSRAAALARNDR